MKIILLDSTDKWLSPIWYVGAWLYCLLGWADEYLAGPDLEKLFFSIGGSDVLPFTNLMYSSNFI